MKRVLGVVAGAALAATALVELAAPQKAEAEPSTYCEIVNMQITMYYDPVPCEILTQLGSSTCASLANGSDWPAAITATRQAAAGFLGSPGNSEAIVRLSDITAAHAIDMLCPELLPRQG